jgi:hypothetical protein
MTLYEMIIDAFPELADNSHQFAHGSITLRNDGGDDYIERWEYSKPLPTALKKYLKK